MRALGSEISDNFLAVTHDRASAFVGKNIGLDRLLKLEYPNLYCLPDPCHGMHLALEKSFLKLPDKIRNFITQIHHHFKFPQRKSLLAQTQAEMPEGTCKGLPLDYCDTRWLSLSESLDRLLNIWPSLTKYMEKMNSTPKHRTSETQNFEDLLQSEIFRLQILCLKEIVGKVAMTNEIFQSQDLRVDRVNQELKSCWKSLTKLILNEEKLTQEHLDSLSVNFDDDEAIKSYTLTSPEFFGIVATHIHPSLSYFQASGLSLATKDEFFTIFKEFLLNLLQKLKKYLMMSDAVLTSSDLVTCDKYIVGVPFEERMSRKLIKINGQLEILEESEIPKVNDEISLINNDGNISVLVSQAQNDSLGVWNLVRSKYDAKKIPCLSKIIPAIHCLPTSSSDVEQGFSIMKLFKSDIRNRLKVETLEGLLMIHQEKDFVISEQLIENYNKMLMDLNLRKSKARNNQQMKPTKKRKDRPESIPTQNIIEEQNDESSQQIQIKNQHQPFNTKETAQVKEKYPNPFEDCRSKPDEMEIE